VVLVDEFSAAAASLNIVAVASPTEEASIYSKVKQLFCCLLLLLFNVVKTITF
jgi:hypothetical protein